jgi:hypothetical protein
VTRRMLAIPQHSWGLVSGFLFSFESSSARMRLHAVICVLVLGIVVVDLTFDSLLLKNTDEALRDLQSYYAVVRATPTVHLITGLNALAGVSLLAAVIYRRSKADIITLIGFALMTPLFMFIMEPIENACIARPPVTAQLRHDLTVVALGHVAIALFLILVTLMQTDWTLTKQGPTKATPAKKKAQ